ncbi:MAG: nicotinate-nicotinamide nucleotide adenylyltransferase, partial [Bdellovibrionales bacterium]|nr:nicotinate-nicotinamide nucleotide adenylyltransferase [Bdellovibrionales bacterium]
MIDFRKATALFGGAFDPVHAGHLHVAREVSRLKPDVEQLVFVPAWRSPGKPPPAAPAADRLHWLELAVRGTPFLVWSWELQRHHESFTVETLKEAHRLGAVKKRLFLVLGGDAYESFERWKNPGHIRELCRLLVAHRSGAPFLAKDPEDVLL